MITVPGIEPVHGEPTRYFVQSSRPGTDPYLVDLAEYDGSGACGCQHFQFRLEPKLKAGERDWTAERTLQCAHIRAAWAVAGPNWAKAIDRNI